MINMNIFFELMSMILKNHMFKVNLSRFKQIFKKCKYIYIYLGCPKKQSKLQVDEILLFFAFLVDGHLKFTYALSIFKGKIIIF